TRHVHWLSCSKCWRFASDSCHSAFPVSLAHARVGGVVLEDDLYRCRFQLTSTIPLLTPAYPLVLFEDDSQSQLPNAQPDWRERHPMRRRHTPVQGKLLLIPAW